MMTAEEHAEIWRKAAQVVRSLDPRLSWRPPQDQQYGSVGRSYSQAEAATWDAYSAAASVLDEIAAEYAKAATPSPPPSP